jgi:predicted ATP-binding protein involved in virulence
MKITELKINNFRGIKELDINLPSSHSNCAIVGINGVGKSSILDFITIMLSPLIKAITKNPKGARVFASSDISNGLEATEGHIAIEEGQENYHWSLIKKLHKEDNPKSSHTGKAKELAEKYRASALVENELSLPIIVHYTVNRAVIDSSTDWKGENSTESIYDAYTDAIKKGQNNFSAFFNWFKSREDIENEIRLNKNNNNHHHRDSQLSAVRLAIESLMEGYRDLQIKRTPHVRMTLSKQNGSDELEVNQLSDGEKCMLAMVGDLSRRMAIANRGMENKLEGRGIVLIDEIDLHLHPRWQQFIMPKLNKTFPNCQFIITTHSPHILSHLQPEEIYLLNNQGGRHTISHPEDSYGLDINSILEDSMSTDHRPPEVKKKLSKLFLMIEEGKLEAAKTFILKLKEEYSDFPELLKASTIISRKEVIGR